MNPSIRRKLERISERFGEVVGLLAESETQSDQNRFRELSREYAQLEPLIAAYNRYRNAERDLVAAEEMLADPEMAALAREEMAEANDRREQLEPEVYRLLVPPDPDDQRNVFLEVRAGTGGAEAALFAGDLLRMYLRYAELMRWQIEPITESPGELGGYKEVIVRIIGNGVFSRLKFEPGAHRVQRVPETESQGRVHTSACTVAVLPEADAIDSIAINPSELRIDTYRSSGAAVSTSTRLTRRSASPTCPPGSSSSARKNVPSTRTGRRPCRCSRPSCCPARARPRHPSSRSRAGFRSAAATAPSGSEPTTSHRTD
jgi:peptide chain release factor 1